MGLVEEGGNQPKRRGQKQRQKISDHDGSAAEDVATSNMLDRDAMARLRLCLQMLDNIQRNLELQEGSGLSLRYNQINTVQKLIRFLEEGGGDSLRGRIKQPTGAGKTVLFGVIAKLIDKPTLVLVPRQNLLSSTKEEFVDMVGIPAETIGLVGAGLCEVGKKITIATYQSHQSLIKRNPSYRAHVRKCELIVCDEAHRSLGERTSESIESLDLAEDTDERSEQGAFVDDTAQEDQELTREEEGFEEAVLQDLDSSTNQGSLKLAFTATPKLANKDVADQFPYLVAEEKQGALVKAGILVPYKIVQVQAAFETVDFEGYLSEEQEATILRRENVYGKLSEEYSRVLSQYRTAETTTEYPLRGIAFCINISECDKFAEEAARLGLRCRIVTSREAKGPTGDTVIKTAEQALLNQEIDLIVTVNKLGEGWNFKPANAAIWARASTSPMVVIQGVGRTCRSYTDAEGRQKPHSLVFETQWSLRTSRPGRLRQPDNTVRKKPLTIGQALALNGENPEEVCSMMNGNRLQIEKFESLKGDGTAIVEGIEYVEPVRYICHMRPYLTEYAALALLRFFPDVRAVRPACPVVSNGKILTCYLKSEIDKVLAESIYIPSNGVVSVPQEGTDETTASVNLECVYAPLYLKDKVCDPKQWLASAVSKGLKEIPTTDFKVFYRGKERKPRTREVVLYKKSAIDELLSDRSIPGYSSVTRLSASMNDLRDGVKILLGDGSERTAVSARCSSAIPAGMYATVQDEIRQRGIKPIEELVLSTNSRPLTLYWKEDIEKIVRSIVEESEAKKEAVLAQKRVEVVARAAAEAQRRQAAQKDTVKEVIALKAPGVFQVRYKMLVNRGTKTIEGEGQAVDISLYEPDGFGSRLTAEEQQNVTRGCTRLPTMTLYWKKDIDDRILQVFGSKARRGQSS